MSPQVDDVFAFSGADLEGVPWWTFFDSNTRKVIYAESGSHQQGSTNVGFEVVEWRPRHTFTNSEFPVCFSTEVEFVNQPVMPLAEYGFIML